MWPDFPMAMLLFIVMVVVWLCIDYVLVRHRDAQRKEPKK